MFTSEKMPTTYGNLDNLLPCIFLWVRWRVPGLDLIFSKLNHWRVSPTCFTSVFTPNFLTGAIKKKSISYRKAEETWALYNQFHPLKAQETWTIQINCLSSLNPGRGQSLQTENTNSKSPAKEEPQVLFSHSI